MRLVIYEYASAQPASVELPASVRSEGRAMLQAVMEDARRLEPAIEVLVADDLAALPTGDGVNDFALVIAPEFDGILERCAQEAQQAGYQLLGPVPSAIRIAADKWQLYLHWKQRGVDTPNTWLHSSEKDVEAKRLVKHRYGAGSLGVTPWRSGDVLQEGCILQEWIAGQVVSVALLISPSGIITPLLPAYQHMSNDEAFRYLGGAFIGGKRDAERVIASACQAVAGLPGLQGYVGVDAILTECQVVAIEINPRLTTSYLGLRKATEQNLVQCMLEVVQSDKQVPIQWRDRDIVWTSESCCASLSSSKDPVGYCVKRS